MANATLYTLDRFEDNDLAVLEDGQGCSLIVPKAWLPSNLKESDSLSLNCEAQPSSSSLCFKLSKNTKLESLESVRAALPAAPDGDISL